MIADITESRFTLDFMLIAVEYSSDNILLTLEI